MLRSRRNDTHHFRRLALEPEYGWAYWSVVAWSCRFRGIFVLPYRWLALGVGFGRSDWRWHPFNNVCPRSVFV